MQTLQELLEGVLSRWERAGLGSFQLENLRFRNVNENSDLRPGHQAEIQPVKFGNIHGFPVLPGSF